MGEDCWNDELSFKKSNRTFAFSFKNCISFSSPDVQSFLSSGKGQYSLLADLEQICWCKKTYNWNKLNLKTAEIYGSKWTPSVTKCKSHITTDQLSEPQIATVAQLVKATVISHSASVLCVNTRQTTFPTNCQHLYSVHSWWSMRLIKKFNQLPVISWWNVDQSQYLLWNNLTLLSVLLIPYSRNTSKMFDSLPSQKDKFWIKRYFVPSFLSFLPL